ncbi:hypothetical protein AWW72_18550 [Acinetobacter sp. NRRL B-65365]|uniref:hypothetical protein n=1 Tax=Acinetobacter sp. NRRL B-65365 TaxID=1785092 RepID=UPI0007A09B2B|nr:hypothetical protein [Acinetobacter sp. NRRL B-65365]KYQ81772.1 hypothetical protein AWW72_18550 [Acinetobacter sp. NRRL B-65365]
MSESNENHRLTPEQLESIGKSLYGTSFKIQLADFLGVDRRRINHWLDGDRPIPVGITTELLEIARKRKEEIEGAIHLLEKILGS